MDSSSFSDVHAALTITSSVSSDVYLQDMSLKCNEEGKSLSTETFAKVSLTNLRRQAVPDLSSDLGMNIFKKVRDIFLCSPLSHKTDVVLTGKPFFFFCFSLRTGVKTGRGRALSPSITQGRSVSAVWGFLSCSTMIT